MSRRMTRCERRRRRFSQGYLHGLLQFVGGQFVEGRWRWVFYVYVEGCAAVFG
jgi:hypothetical protein